MSTRRCYSRAGWGECRDVAAGPGVARGPTRDHHRYARHGRREIAKSPWPMHRYADLVDRVLADLEVDAVHIIGLWFGGMLAPEVAHRHSARVESLSLINTSWGARLRPE